MSHVQTSELGKDALAEAQKNHLVDGGSGSQKNAGVLVWPEIQDSKERDSCLKDKTEDVEGDDCSVKSLTEDEQETEHKPDADESAENHLEGRDAEKEPRQRSPEDAQRAELGPFGQGCVGEPLVSPVNERIFEAADLGAQCL